MLDDGEEGDGGRFQRDRKAEESRGLERGYITKRRSKGGGEH